MKNLICYHIAKLIPLYLEGKTSEAQTSEIINHLEICDDCREKYLSIKEISEKIKKAFDEIDKNNFDSDYIFFKDNLSACIDNELSKEDYLKFNNCDTSHADLKKELEEMLSFREQLQKMLNEQNFLEKDLSDKIVNTIKEEEPEYLSNLFLKAAVITVFFILITILTGYLSVKENIPDLSEITNKIFTTISVHNHQERK